MSHVWKPVFAACGVLICALLAGGCHGPAVRPEKAGFVSVAGTNFLDGAGRPLLLHGVNVVEKSKASGYMGDLTPSDFAAIRNWGMNFVRLGVFWDGLEPEPGRIDEVYLDRVALMVSWARAAGLYVMLDMHQDLYSVRFSDGAPAWATLDEGKPHAQGPVWSDAYYVSEAVQSALDNFWANAPAPDGVGLQDHYARVWRRVAERFKDEPAVVGFDLMNEPFPGRDAGRVQIAIMARLAELLSVKEGGGAATVAQLAGMQGTAEGRRQITAWLADTNLYQGMLEAGVPIMAQFDRERLQPFYARVHRAIREVNRRQIIFLEPAMSANLGIPSSLVPLVDGQGYRDPQQAYAPHGYDIVVDTAAIDLTCNARVALIFRRHGEFARRHRLPMLVGEWGAYYMDPRAADSARFVVGVFDALGCGDAYWAYRRELAASPLLGAMRRASGAIRPGPWASR